MGVAQIMLDDLDLSNIVIGWYKLFGTSSLVNVPPGGGKDKKKESTVWIIEIIKNQAWILSWFSRNIQFKGPEISKYLHS